MELMAVIVGLEAVKPGYDVTVHSDSRYVVDAVTKGWAVRWRAQGWMRNRKDRAENADLWERLLDLCRHRTVRFLWEPGHAGHPENERCDALAVAAAKGSDQAVDAGYERASPRGDSGRTGV
ncbi:MAG TPA: ribonuclease H, partial [Syntrophales bacterium]|jgi:ribonuclease HI|nr:ribonuclease H [Syntrophales bacterium]